jgi:tRNA nucleotidyltransferase (CCA-adding enzyme)
MKEARREPFLDALPGAAAALVGAVIAAADARRLAVYVVGGPVRDLLLSRDVGDVDLIVEGRDGGEAEALARSVATPPVRVTAHDRFGTVSLRATEFSVDLATVRRETYAHDGALPTVSAGSLEDDLRRRDFTVNALALPLSRAARERHAGLVDLVGGVADLEARRLRILHRRSFHDDPTRALRAARLAPRLGFGLTRGSRTALRDALRDGSFGRVSGDRLRREIVKVFDDARLELDPARALRLLDEWHVLGALEPGLGLARQAAPALRRLGRVIASPPWPPARWAPWVSGVAVWLAPEPPDLRRRTLRRLAVRGAALRRIQSFPKACAGWLRSLARARGRGAVDAVLRGLDEEELHALLVSAPAPVRRRIVRYAREDRLRRTPVNGEDLLALGLSGPAVGRALTRIRAAFLDGNVKTREEALALARELAEPRTGRAAARKGASGAAPARKRSGR